MSIQQQINEAMEHFNLSKEENQEIHIGRRIDDFDTTLENSVSAIKAMDFKGKRKVKTTLAYDLDYPYFLIIITVQ